MNWYKLAQILLSVGAGAAGLFIKNPSSQKTADSIFHLVQLVVEGVANQNPDGTPAEQPYVPSTQVQGGPAQ